MSECKLSILVPFYNVGEFIKPLLDCFEKLTLPEEDYEIIFWNDGSTDQSADYVKAFLGAKKNRFLYSSSNLGIYPARNKLLNEAKGDYIWFVDADDLLEPSKVSGLLEKCFENDLDLLSFSYEKVTEDLQTVLERCVMQDTGLVRGRDYYSENKMDGYLWIRFFKRKMLLDSGLRFDESLKVLGDYDFTQKIVSVTDRMMVVSDVAYTYRERNGSLLHEKGSDERVVLALLKILANLNDYYTERNDSYLLGLSYYRTQRQMNVILRFVSVADFEARIRSAAKRFVFGTKAPLKYRFFALCEFVSPAFVCRFFGLMNKVREWIKSLCR